MSLSQSDAERLLSSGFLMHEIDEIANAKALDGSPQPPVDLNNPAWQATMKTRLEWWQDKIKRDWTAREIEREIMLYYEGDSKRSPFDFLKAEFSGAKPTYARLDYMEARRRKYEAQTKKMGKYEKYRA